VTNSKAIRGILLIFSIILLGSILFNYKYVKDINENYNDIFSKESKEFQAFESITIESSTIQRALLNIAILVPHEYIFWQDKIDRSQVKVDQDFNNLILLADSPDEKIAVGKLKDSYVNYQKDYQRLDILLLAENFEGTHQDEKIKELGVTYDSYMKQQENQLAFFRQNAEAKTTNLRASSHLTSTILLIVGTLPYTLLACVIVISFIVLMLLGSTTRWFNHQEHY
jgi:hypothetical protein